MVDSELLDKLDVMAKTCANKALVQTAPALCNFGIIARHNHFGGGVGAFLPHRALVRLHNAGVSPHPR